jgi:hypothetical protein
MKTGGCHCGAVRYEVEGAPEHHCLCFCSDCRRHAGAPMVGWALFPNERFRIVQGSPRTYASSEHALRHFCADCGTSLFYTNEQIFPSQTDIQTGTLDDPNALGPQARIQLADAPEWARHVDSLPGFERYPSQ